ncbi:MAG: hypothetical protein BZY88_00350 [SAR202 cluster bacterium Io17-Chloro-G9]|nr:MAG: hypothetical protein BZY88_00350 [SAR202 cluster bacterium Io17-Chloro-G9]
MIAMIYRRVRVSTRWVIPVLTVLAVSMAVACGSAATATLPSAPEVTLGVGTDGLTPILATTVLQVGAQRVSFLLTTPDSLIKVPGAVVTSVFLGDGEAATETKRAGFHIWPYGVRGSYATEINFDRPGRWRLDIEVDREGVPGKTFVEVNVAAEGIVPGVGTVPPLSINKTLSQMGDMDQLTTDYSPDPDLYQITIADAVTTGKPTVVVFASPAFCTSPTCGPQTDTVTELKEAYVSKANFIHVEIYDDPHLIQGDLSQATLVQAVDDWGISAVPGWFNESWTFVLDKNGAITQRFEGYATLEELEEALTAVLGQV